MNAPLPMADIDVRYVNAPKPGKKMGNVKDAQNQYWFVRPEMLSQFSPGMKCKVEYDSSTGADGTEFRRVTKIIGGGVAPAIPKHNYSQRKNPAEAKQIAVLALVKEWMSKIPVGDEAALIHAIQVCMSAYDKTLSGVQAQRADDLNDEIGF